MSDHVVLVRRMVMITDHRMVESYADGNLPAIRSPRLSSARCAQEAKLGERLPGKWLIDETSLICMLFYLALVLNKVLKFSLNCVLAFGRGRGAP